MVSLHEMHACNHAPGTFWAVADLTGGVAGKAVAKFATLLRSFILPITKCARCYYILPSINRFR